MYQQNIVLNTLVHSRYLYTGSTGWKLNQWTYLQTVVFISSFSFYNIQVRIFEES